MFFFLIRILPFAAPAFYLLLLNGLYYFDPGRTWYIFIIAILFVDFVFFFLANLKLKDKKIFPLFLHSVLFVATGVAVIMLLTNYLAVNLFALGWSLIYLIYLEAIFNYLYQTKKIFLIDFNNIIAYVNLIVFFLISAVLFNVYAFLSFYSWGVWAIVVVSAWLLLFNRLLVSEAPLDAKARIIYASAEVLILSEFFWAVLTWPVAFLVSAMVMALAYYALSSLSILYLEKKLNRQSLWHYLVFIGLALVAVLATAVWL